MKYVNAQKVLPQKLLKELQTYIQGEILYVPKSPERHEQWGALSGIKDELAERNMSIKKDYAKGKSFEELSRTYHLSPETLKKIIYKKEKLT